jgi:hypothetical protein
MVAAVTASLLVAAPALADSFSHVDPARDMHRFTESGDALDPTHRNGDIRGAVLRHRLHFVTIRVNFRDLHPAAGRNGLITLSGRIKVNPGADADPIIYLFRLTTSRPNQPDIETFDSPDADEPFCSNETAGDGLVGRVDYDANTISFKIPRPCLHRPRWVRVSMGSDVQTGTGLEWFDGWINPGSRTTFTRRLFPG